MVIGEATPPTGPGQMTAPPGVLQEKIDNIMGGISNTGTVKMNNHRKKLRQRFDIIKKLGQGTYGKVQLGINKETGQEVAIKTIKKCKIEAESDLIRIRREVQIMSSVQHPNIIHIYEVFENREKMVLVMEFAAGGELYDYLSERKVLAEDEARRIFRQVATAVYYCHKHKICHRDLKLENILLDEHGNAKIADFGLSNVFDDQRLLSTYCGSPLYASPEIVKGTPYQGPEVDCWSLGVLLYTLVYGAMPFDGSQFKRLVKQISQGDYYEPKKPSPASPLIREMLTVCPQRRANIEQICSHWWVNEGYSGSCLDIAEDLANQTPVRLDVLLSLSPPSVTADQLVVPSGDDPKSNVPRSHSVGSIREIGNTEAERRILDMVAAGGEAALMPSPTRTITPNESPVQPKRKLENTVSTENAAGIVKKKERPGDQAVPQKQVEEMDVDQEQDTANLREGPTHPTKTSTQQELANVETACEELMEETSPSPTRANQDDMIPRQRTITKLDAVKESDESPPPTKEISPQKVIKKFVNKHKTADLVAAINKMSEDKNEELQRSQTTADRKGSLQDENRRRSRIIETTEKFQNVNTSTSDKPKKFVIPGGSVSNYKKEFERKASEPSSKPNSSAERSPTDSGRKEGAQTPSETLETAVKPSTKQAELSESESKTSVESFSLKEARRSMENSIALLNQAKEESSREVEQLCAKTENIAVTEPERDREKKKAREIIGNAINPTSRLCMGVRKPPVPFGINGRSISGSVVPPMNTEKKTMRVQMGPESGDVRTATISVSTPEQRIYEKEPQAQATIKATTAQLEGSPPPSTTKTSRAEITLKSATLPRRKPGKTEIQLEIKPRHPESTMRFSTEMQHQVPDLRDLRDLRSAPIREGPYSPISTHLHQRATSVEPTVREHVIPIQRPSVYVRSGSYRSGSLSRQSTNESDTDTTTGAQSQSTITTGTSTSQPIKKSPREFIIPIAVEGGGYVTPRAGSLEPSDSGHTTSSAAAAFSRTNRPRRVGSLFTEEESGDDGHFHKIRTTSINKDIDPEEPPRFTMHRLRSTRPIKKLSQDTNDSQSSGEDDDEDGFEILTAENLFSTLLQRVRALTNRLNVNNDLTAGFPNSSRLLGNMRQAHSPFWQQEPFARSQFSYSFKSETVEKKQLLNSNSGAGAAWRHSFSRDLGSDIDSMFSRTGATLPRGSKKDKSQQKSSLALSPSTSSKSKEKDVALDLADLDLSRLRLTKKDLETLSTITPNLPKCFQEQLLAKLPPTQARKLSRTLSMQNNSESTVPAPSRVYKRSLSGGRDHRELSEKPGSEGSSDKQHTRDSTERSEMSSSSYERSLDKRRGSMGKDRYGNEATTVAAAAKSTSSSTCKSADDYSRSLCSSYTSDVSDRYKYYSPYLTKRSNVDRPISPVSPFFDKESDIDRSISPCKYYEGSSSPRNSCFSPVKDIYSRGRPPSGCLSPPPVLNDASLRRRSSQRRVSRFLRPDFFETSLNEQNAYLREKKLRERETQNVLREIREKSRDRSRDRRNHSVERVLNSEEKEKLENLQHPLSMRDVRNKSVDRYIEAASKDSDNLLQRTRRSASRPREIVDEIVSNQILQSKGSTRVVAENLPNAPNDPLTEQPTICSISKSNESAERVPIQHFDASHIANKILEELQSISLNTKVSNIPKDGNATAENREKQNRQTIIIEDSPQDKDKLAKMKKVKPKDPSLKKEKKVLTASVSEKQSDPKAPSEEKVKKESKLIRPKSYPIKEPEKGLSGSCVKFQESTPSPPEKSLSPIEVENSAHDKDNSRINRPKSYPNSKITPPKDFKKFSRSGMGISAVMEKLMEKADKPNSAAAVKKLPSKLSSSEDRLSAGKSSDSATITIAEQKPLKKVIKKKLIKSDSKQSPEQKEKASSTDATDTGTSDIGQTSKKDKSPEKKVSKGLLYAIGQKFKNLQENAKNREKKLSASTTASTIEALLPETSANDTPHVSVTIVLKKKKSKSNIMADSVSPEKDIEKTPSQKAEEKAVKQDKRSRIDAMIRSLRERSIPRAPVMTESGLIKRAVSVEDFSGTFNKCAVNKVLGLFKKYEKDGTERKVMNARSTSNIERHVANTFAHKERPKSSGFIGKLKRNSAGPSSTDNVTARQNILHEPQVVADLMLKNNLNSAPLQPAAPAQIISSSKETCQDCIQELSIEPRKRNTLKSDIEEQDKEKSKEKRKGLLLDFSKLDNVGNKCRVNNNLSNNYTSLSFGTLNNNNSFIANNCEINQNNLLTPSNENITNNSSSSKSPQDDCPSSSTFLSPSEEPELCFDNWSVCSEDNCGVSTPSPTVSRLSRASQLSSPVSLDTNNPESVIDRIKRRSFYTRFNEKKPKRQSNIVGPGARDYYRESAAKLRSRPPDRISSPEINNATNTTPEYLRPLKLTTNISDLKPPLVQVRRRYDDDLKHINPTNTTDLDFLKPSRSTFNDMLPPMNLISKRYGETDIRRYEPSYASSLYNTYSPKRRSSFTSNGYVPASSSTTISPSDRMTNIEGYATLGRLLNSTQNTAKSPSVGAFRRDHQRAASDFGNLPKLFS